MASEDTVRLNSGTTSSTNHHTAAAAGAGAVEPTLLPGSDSDGSSSSSTDNLAGSATAKMNGAQAAAAAATPEATPEGSSSMDWEYPEFNAGWWSRAWYSWATPMLKLGSKRFLGLDDMWSFPEHMKTQSLTANFQRHWQAEKRFVKHRSATRGGLCCRSCSGWCWFCRCCTRRTSYAALDGNGVGTSTATGAGTAAAIDAGSEAPSSDSRGGPSLLRTIFRWHGPQVLIVLCVRILGELSALLGPLVLHSIVDTVHSWSTLGNAGSFELVLGLGIGLFACKLLQTLFIQHALFRIITLSIQTKMALTTSVYLHSLKLNPSALQDTSVGKITNLMSSDCEKARRMLQITPHIIILPATILSTMALLVAYVGFSALAGIAIMALVIPIQTRLTKWTRKLRKRSMKSTDERVKIITEVVQGVRVVKTYAWEDAFAKRVHQARGRELSLMRLTVCSKILTVLLLQTSPVTVALATFAAVALWSGEPLTPAKAFTALALFNVLRFPFRILPFIINGVVDGMVSLQRVEAFLHRRGTAEDYRITDGATTASIPRRQRQGDTSDSEEVEEEEVEVEAAPFDHHDGGAGCVDAAGVGIELGPMRTPVSSKRGADKGSEGDEDDGEGEGEGMDKFAVPADVDILVTGGCFTWGTTNPPDATGAGAGAGAGVGAGAGAGVSEPDSADDSSQASSAASTAAAGGLSDIELRIPHGSFVCVVGAVGSGKSTLLRSILGETDRVAGRVAVRGPVAFADQSAFVMNTTVRENIVFHSEWDEEWYWEVIQACALTEDLQQLPQGDATEIGERGITLSGGQKQRVSLARAVYSRARVVLMDDCLSAVDSHTGRHIVNHVLIKGAALEGATRVLCLHQLYHVPNCDWVIFMDQGAIVAQGTCDDLLRDCAEFSMLMAKHGGMGDGSEADGEGAAGAVRDEVGGGGGAGDDEEAETGPRARVHSAASTMTAASGGSDGGTGAGGAGGESKDAEDSSKLMQEEERAVGAVKARVCWGYAKAGGILLWVLIMTTYLLSVPSTTAVDWWLVQWTTSDLTYVPAGMVRAANLTSVETATDNGAIEVPRQITLYYVAIYALFSCLSIALIACRGIMVALMGLRAASRLHRAMYSRVMRATVAFFDTTPIGRIMNRFAKDTAEADDLLPYMMRNMLDWSFAMIVCMFALGFASPWMILMYLPLTVFYWRVQGLYRRSSRELKRLHSITSSPIFSHFGETLHGLTTIRAFGGQAIEGFRSTAIKRVNDNLPPGFTIIAASRWLGLRLEGLAAIVVLAVTVVVALTHKQLGPGMAGFAISYSLRITRALNWLVRSSVETELGLNSVERILYYTNSIEQEAPAIVKETQPAAAWPRKGAVEFRKLSYRYRPKLPLVLRRVNLSILPGEHVGVCGRTGSGKSTLVRCLFRLAEPAHGTVVIDGVDTSKVGLHTLRSRLSIIPQDAVLFVGTLRDNLDPEGRHDDDAIWSALARVQLADHTKSLEGGLGASVQEGGANWSAGQRQLLCMARAVLRGSRVLVMDESTASVDMETDERIQAMVRDVFTDCTVIAIAHRLATIMDYDRIVVMDNGRVAEVGRPAELLTRPDGLFAALVKESREAGQDPGEVVAHVNGGGSAGLAAGAGAGAT